jgi:PAS domain S-box-containing protein
MRLSSFIVQHREPILQQWEDFARTIEPPALTMDIEALRDHASFLLDTVVKDLDTSQSEYEQSEKSKGKALQKTGKTYAEIHAETRLSSGYSIDQLISEYRALRASVLKLWARNSKATRATDPEDVPRFNEAIDQALAESVACYSRESTSVIEYERRQLNAILEAAPVGIAMTDLSGKLLRSNAENKRIWGGNPATQDVSGYSEWKGWWADGTDRHGKRLQAHDWVSARALSGSQAARDIVEIEPFGSPGTRRTVELHATPVRDEQQNVIGSVVAQMDITARVKAEAALRESEAKFRTIANAMPQMVWSTLADGFHDYYNQQWYDFTGVPQGSTDGEAWNGMFHPDDQERAWGLWRTSLETGEAYEIQYRLRHHSGEYHWTLGRALPVRSETGEIIRWMGTCTDIHDQKVAEENLKNADQRKDDFLAMLAHELRNPLAPIGAAAELLKLPALGQEVVRQTSEVIARQVKHMSGLVDDLLDVSRVTRGAVELEKAPLDIRDIVMDAVEQVNPLMDARRHHFMLHLPPAMAIVTGDHKRLVQVMGNVLTNAAKYTPEGGNILLEVSVGVEQVDLTVVDDGIGMAPNLVRQVFDLFSQAERTSDRSGGGLGLGLALVKSLVELHGGSVTCASPGLGKGSRFTVCLPRTVSQPLQADRPRTEAERTRAGKSLNIMIVDDNADAAQMLAMYLEAAGHSVIVEHGSRRALERARIEQLDVCLLDIGLPEMDGNDLAKRLRSRPECANLMLIAITGYGQEADKRRSLEAGFDHHLVKPIDVVKLANVLTSVSA